MSVRVPAAIYRLQVSPTFTLDDAARLVPYLDSLGITDAYLSPIFEARPGSTHGYDVTDPTAVRAEIGGEPARSALAIALRDRSMGLLLDIVPNHMAATPHNPWWRDLLEFGEDSPHARWFDRSWRSIAGDAVVELPILPAEPDVNGLAFEHITLDADDDGLAILCAGHRLPLTPASYPFALRIDTNPVDADRAGALRYLIGLSPPGMHGQPQRLERREAARAARDRFLRTFREDASFRAWVKQSTAEANALEPRLRHRHLEGVLERQPYRLRGWRTATRDISYRRFFDVTHLVGVRVEQAEVFESAHALIRAWIDDGFVTGLRVDHIDGLRDPESYLRRLRRCGPVYTVVEKVLGPRETLRASWAAGGTTGYDFLNIVNGWFIEPEGWSRLVAAWTHATGRTERFEDIVHAGKKRVLERMFGGEIAKLVDDLRALERAAVTGVSDTTTLELALLEVTAALDVYRTYISERGIAAEDRTRIESAIARAARSSDALEFLLDVLLLDPSRLGDARDQALEFVLHWQQFTGPVMAKGLEDTALYNYHPLVAANDVGGNPASPVTSTQQLHAFLADRASHTPHTLNATSTHDTKRGEDVRARLDVLSELTVEWEELLAMWAAGRRPRRDSPVTPPQNPMSERAEVSEGTAGEATIEAQQPEDPPGSPELTREDELLLLQTLLGTWPLDGDLGGAYATRIIEYMVKAAREAKQRTTWHDPAPDYEAALARRVEDWLDGKRDTAFRERTHRLAEAIAYPGALNALALVVLKVTAPGVPEFYQGSELWSFPLVDPDNRCAVDFDQRAEVMREVLPLIHAPSEDKVRELLASWNDGRIKLFITAAALHHRREHAERFEHGRYLPVDVAGDTDRVFAFARTHGDGWTMTVVSRWHASPPRRSRDDARLQLPAGSPRRWRDVFTGAVLESGNGGSLQLTEVLRTLPVAVLGGE